jgi:microcystin-dependent protein
MIMKKMILAVIISLLTGTAFAQDKTEPKGSNDYVGEIMLFAGWYTPANYMDCAGQTLPIVEYEALFSVIGTTFGGDGANTFMLPDLRGRAPIGAGDGPSTSDRTMGEQGGYETVTLTASNMPVHSHTGSVSSTGTIMCDTGTANDDSPSGNSPSRAEIDVYSTNAATTPMKSGTVQTSGSFTSNPAGSGAAHENMPPFLTIRYCICVQGIYP